MRSNKKRNIMPDAIGYIDDDIVSGVLSKIDKENTIVYRPRKRGVSSWAAVAAAIAACAALLILAIPTTTITSGVEIFSPVAAPDASVTVEKSPEHDGSKGLLYEINENGTSASFIGFGSCSDETVYIASTYEDLPVTVMYNKDDYTSFVPYNQSKVQNIKHLVISDTVKYVDSSFISQCPYIESVYIGASVENIKTIHFNPGYGVYFSKIEVSPDNPYYSGKGNCLVDLRSKVLVIGTHKTVIPDDGSVEIIGSNAFSPAKYWLGSIVIPEGVKIIDFDAFGDCDKLGSVILPDSLEVLDAEAFSSCKNLKKIELGTNLKAIDVTVFYAIHPPEVYYKGTVEQWKAVIKNDLVEHKVVTVVVNDDGVKTEVTTKSEYTPEVFTVICTDGVSDSIAGENGDYDWRLFPEYEEYEKRAAENSTRYIFNPDGTTTKVYPWEKYVKE